MQVRGLRSPRFQAQDTVFVMNALSKLESSMNTVQIEQKSWAGTIQHRSAAQSSELAGALVQA
jgi:hypothetical protein